MSKLHQNQKSMPKDIQEMFPYTTADPCIDCPFCGKDNVYCHVCPYDD